MEYTTQNERIKAERELTTSKELNQPEGRGSRERRMHSTIEREALGRFRTKGVSGVSHDVIFIQNDPIYLPQAFHPSSSLHLSLRHIHPPLSFPSSHKPLSLSHSPSFSLLIILPLPIFLPSNEHITERAHISFPSLFGIRLREQRNY